MSYNHESEFGHDLLWDILRRIRHFWPQNLRFRKSVLCKIILRNSYEIAVELVLFQELLPALWKFYFLLVLDCHELSDTETVVPPLAALLWTDLPAVTFVHSCNSQTVSIYGISNTVTVCCYSCYGTELFIAATVRQSVSTVSITLSLSAVTVVTSPKPISVSPSVDNSYFMYFNIFILALNWKYAITQFTFICAH
jgi:hypothetical protein